MEEVAQTLGVSVHTVRYWRYSGTGPPSIKVGRVVRFDPNDLADWLNANRSPKAVTA